MLAIAWFSQVSEVPREQDSVCRGENSCETSSDEIARLKPKSSRIHFGSFGHEFVSCEATDKLTDYNLWPAGILACIISAWNSMLCINIVYRDICTHFSEQSYTFSASFISRLVSSLFWHTNYLYVIAIAISLELDNRLRHIVNLHSKLRYELAETL